ncbi:hypothetical protein HS088_TW13G01442 [Tripterygium wilfordii]|uniref:Pentatricopeptide repeat-containing protein n=1 Tax=Tripterygium wilfordii TaxID=458696 RepID=A0A7J7CWM3_TRIWF|nr:pentatricopeptide repeat-containing protein At4g02750-like [Tripterygium wilfordii]KAF5738542.1 hypothetical protein HS088_TW13G01442 [Tripterygium wilfordii]
MFSISPFTRLLRRTQTRYQKLTKTFSTVNNTSVILPNLKPLNSQITYCMRNGLVEEAQELFDKIPQRNTVTWNAMIRGFFQNGKSKNALSLYNQMPERDVFTFNTVISGLMRCGDVGGAREVFDRVPVRDVVTWNSMVAGYFDNGLIAEALRMFDVMPMKDVISWNLVIGGLAKRLQLDLAEEYFRLMDVRDVVSWTIILSGLASAGRIDEACQLFEHMPIKDIRAWNTLMGGCIENGCIDIAEDLFRRIPEPDLDSWKQFISGLVSCGRINDALSFFMEMPIKCQKIYNLVLLGIIRNGLVKDAHAFLEKSACSDVISQTNIIVGYFEIGDVETAVKLFESMPTRDVTVWNVVIFGLGSNDGGEEGLKYFIRMKESGPAPDKATITSVLAICSDLPTLTLGKQTHSQAIRLGLDKFTPVSNAVVSMYARCGTMDLALLEFVSMTAHDVISWNSIICGFAHHGDGEKALEMFEQMKTTDVKPNHITFIGVLSACSHAGLIDEGRYYFDYMRNKCFLQPKSEHYTCLVDLMGRFGLINEAMIFLKQMITDGIEVPASIWGALLGACRIHKNFEVGEIAGKRVLETEPYNSGVYIILAEMHLSRGRKEDAERILALMKEKGVKKQPGCSWVQVNSNEHVFLSGDSLHPEYGRIRGMLDFMYMDMEDKIRK